MKVSDDDLSSELSSVPSTIENNPLGATARTALLDDNLSSELSSVPSGIGDSATFSATGTTLLDVVTQLKAEVKAEVKQEMEQANNARLTALEAGLAEKMETRVQEAVQFIVNSDNHSQDAAQKAINEFCSRFAAQAKTEIMAAMREQQERFARRLVDLSTNQEVKELRNVVSGLKVQVEALYALLAAQRDGSSMIA
jgi:polyhydroxyalkanoate synthesis regulator phasin